MSHIFISYSHRDINFAQKIVDALAANNLDTWIDWKSIPKGDDWWLHIQSGIEEADAFLFLVSPDSASSKVCSEEIDHAVKNGKRILPILIRDTDPSSAHFEISKRNWIFCRDQQDDFGKAIDQTLETIHTDYEWLKYHTELQVKALKWEQKKDNSRLLRGKELREAEQQLASAGSQKEPQPIQLQRQFVLASQRDDIGRRNRTVVISLFAGIIMVTLGIYGLVQANLANERAKISLARQLAAESQAIAKEYPQRSVLLALESLNITTPQLPVAEQALRDTLSLPKGVGLSNQDGNVSAFDFSPDGHWLATGSDNGAVQLWDLSSINTFTFSINLGGSDFGIDTIAFSKDKRWLAASDDLNLHLWDLNKEPFSSDSIVLEKSLSRYMFSSDGHWLVTDSANTAKLWDLKSDPNFVAPITLHEYSGFGTGAIAYSYDGNLLAISDRDNHNVDIWDLKNIKPTSTPIISLYDSQTGFISFSNNGNWLTSHDIFSTTVCLWDLSKPEPTKTIIAGYDIESSPDGLWLAINDLEDNTVQLWNLETSGQLQKPFILRGHTSRISSMIFSLDGYFFAAGSDNGTILLWNLKLPDPSASPLFLKGEKGIEQLIFTANGNHLASVEGNLVRVWDLRHFSGDPIVVYNHDTQIGLANFSPDSHWLATNINHFAEINPHDDYLRLWNLADPNQLISPKPYKETREYGVISPNGRWLVSLGSYVQGQVLDLSLKEPLAHSIPLEILITESPSETIFGMGSIENARFSSDGRWLVTSGDFTSETSQLWDMNATDPAEYWDTLQGKLVDSIQTNERWLVTYNGSTDYFWDTLSIDPSANPIIYSGELNNLDLSPDGRWMAGMGRDDSCQLVDLTKDSGSPIATIKGGEGCRISPDGHWLIISSDITKNTQLMDLTISKPSDHIVTIKGAVGLSGYLSADGHWLITYVSSGDSYIPGEYYLWDLSASDFSEPSKRLQAYYSSDTYFSSDGHWLVIPGTYLVDLSQTSFTISELPSSYGETNFVYFSKDGRWLITGGYQSKIAYLLDLTNPDPGKSVAILRGHEAEVNFFAFDPTWNWLATGSNDGDVRLWNLSANDPSADSIILRGNKEPITFIAFTTDGKQIIAGDGNTTRAWNTDVNDLKELACTVTGRNLTQAEWQQYFPGEAYRITCSKWPAGE